MEILSVPGFLFCACVSLLLLQAVYLVDCMTDKTKGNKILNIGGPDDGLTMTAQGKLVSQAAKQKRTGRCDREKLG